MKQFERSDARATQNELVERQPIDKATHTHTPPQGFPWLHYTARAAASVRNSEGKQVQVTMRKRSYMAHVVKGKDPDLPHKFSLWSWVVLLGVWVEVPRDLCDYALE